MYKDYIYIQSGFDSINDMPNENFGTWRISKDGKNKIDLMGFCPSYMVFLYCRTHFGCKYNPYTSIILLDVCQISESFSFHSEVTPEKMFYAGNSIFYYKFPGIYKAQADKWKENDLKLSVFTEDCFQTDGKNYYVCRTHFGCKYNPYTSIILLDVCQISESFSFHSIQ